MPVNHLKIRNIAVMPVLYMCIITKTKRYFKPFCAILCQFYRKNIWYLFFINAIMHL